MATGKKIRGAGEYNVPKTWDVHQDAVKSLDRTAAKFNGFYKRKHLVTFGILLLEKEINNRRIKAGDDIEDILGIQADKPGSGKKAGDLRQQTT